MVIHLFLGCVPAMDDNSLEAIQLDAVSEDTSPGVSGILEVAAGDAAGDWSLAVDTTQLTYHSPSGVDFSALDGQTVTLTTWDDVDTPAMVITDDEGPLFVEGGDGTNAFGRAVWTWGDVIGVGTVGGEQDARFTDVVVDADGGEVRVLPGVPTTITLDGAPWRFTVIAAYEAINTGNSKCGAPDMLAVELIRTDADPGQPLVRPAALRPPIGTCG